MIPEILDFIANSVFVGSMPGNGKREWTFIAILVLMGILIVGLLVLITR